jgi:hypothetical protein
MQVRQHGLPVLRARADLGVPAAAVMQQIPDDPADARVIRRIDHVASAAPGAHKARLFQCGKVERKAGRGYRHQARYLALRHAFVPCDDQAAHKVKPHPAGQGGQRAEDSTSIHSSITHESLN